MAVPPTYADLGKSARDVFTKGYGECCMEWPFSSETGFACLVFYLSQFERAGSVSF